MMKKIVVIIGAGLLAGTVVYVFLNKTEKKRTDINGYFEKDLEKHSLYNTEIINQTDFYGKNVNLEDVKTSVANNIQIRHVQASNVMRDIVDTIYSRMEDSADRACDLNLLSDELNKLLSEE